MDLAFFGLAEPPFNPTPNPRFLHLTPGHQEALAQLLYGVEQRKGFILISGEVGTGKTTLLHALLERLGPTTAAALIPTTMLDFEGILEYTLEEFGVGKAGDSSTAKRLLALRQFLADRHLTGQNTVLIIDEAQDLSTPVLEHIRLLSNFEAAGEKILQIILAGQPELRANLERPELRQLRQRITLRSTLSALAPEQIRDYIRTRLRVAGARDLGLFTAEAVARIARYSGGIPRIVNTVCDHCLLFAYAEQVRRIGPQIVDDAIDYLEAGSEPRSKQIRFAGSRMTRGRWTALAAAAGVAVLTLLTLAHPDSAWRAAEIGASSLSDLVRFAGARLPR